MKEEENEISERSNIIIMWHGISCIIYEGGMKIMKKKAWQ